MTKFFGHGHEDSIMVTVTTFTIVIVTMTHESFSWLAMTYSFKRYNSSQRLDISLRLVKCDKKYIVVKRISEINYELEIFYVVKDFSHRIKRQNISLY